MLIETCLTYSRIIVLSLCLWMYVTIAEMIFVAVMDKADLGKKEYIISGLVCVFLAAIMYHFMDAVQIGIIITLSLGCFWSIIFIGFSTYAITSLIVKKAGVSFGDWLFAFVFTVIISIIVLLLFKDMLFISC